MVEGVAHSQIPRLLASRAERGWIGDEGAEEEGKKTGRGGIALKSSSLLSGWLALC